ncbi:hypothetical protein [Qipengyuania sp. RANM35]|uniref:hypothetical protein n=1 Tax=Qipengyuania sp. RANM35 TaxID=3068635 RepID=UPI0034DB3EBB
MQGRWRDPDDGALLVIDGFNVLHRDQSVAHDFFNVEEDEGALIVTLGVDDVKREDSFQRENVAGLVIDPDGTMNAYNTRFGATFERIGDA